MKKALLVALTLPALFAQDYKTTLGTGTGEFIGGVQHVHSGGTDPVIGGKLLAGLSRWLSLYGEYSYSRVRSQDFYTSNTIALRTSLMDMGGGVEVHWSGGRLQPYLLGGIGSARDSSTLSVGAAHLTRSAYHLTGSVGGGVRMFVTRRAGFLAEVKSVNGDGFGFERYAFGVFYQQPRASE
jgi:hypothetical protein